MARVLALGVILGAIGTTLISTVPPTAAVPRQIPAGEGGAEARMAAAVWEQGIAAKGGRDRLQAIRNFVVASREVFSRSARPDVATHEDIDRLYVLGGKLWEFIDHLPAIWMPSIAL